MLFPLSLDHFHFSTFTLYQVLQEELVRDAKGFKQVDSSVLTDHQNYCQSFQLKAGQIIFALVNL